MIESTYVYDVELYQAGRPSPASSYQHSIKLKPSTNNCPITIVKIFYQLLYLQVNSKCSEVPVNYLVFKLK